MDRAKTMGREEVTVHYTMIPELVRQHVAKRERSAAQYRFRRAHRAARG